MRKSMIMTVLLASALGVGMSLLTSCASRESQKSLAGTSTKQSRGSNNEILSFPFKKPKDVKEFACFGLSGWDKDTSHAGIDCIPFYETMSQTKQTHDVVAPVNAQVAAIFHPTSGAGKRSHVIVLKINDHWFVTLNFEAQSSVEHYNEVVQLEHIKVSVGQNVSQGQSIGQLVAYMVARGSYPHIHYGLLYKAPGQTLEDIAEDHAGVARSDGAYLPAMTGPLRIPSTFFCPYEYSNLTARAVFDSKPKLDVDGVSCNSVCAYGSVRGGCGAAGAQE